MKSFLLKVIVCPIALIFSDRIFPGVDFSDIRQTIFVGIILAVVGTLMEFMLLREGTLWISIFADFAATIVIVYFVTNVLSGADVTFWGALLTSVLITAIEIPTHLWLIRGGYTRKSATHFP